jgi:hypothetical protein
LASRRSGDQSLTVLGSVNHPDDVLDAVVGDEIVGWLRGREPLDQGIDLRTRLVGQEDRAGVGIESVDMTGPIVLLDGPRVLVLLDQVGLVLVDARTGDQPRLDVVTHSLAIEVESRRVIAHEDAVAHQPLQVFSAFRIDLRRIHIDAGLEVDLRFDHVEERQGLVSSHRACLVARQYIVGRARHLGAKIRTGAPPPKRLDSRHRNLLAFAVTGAASEDVHTVGLESKP